MNNNYLFVYGTLMSKFTGDKPLSLSDHGKLLGRAYVFGKLYKVSWYPAIILNHTSHSRVWGELYEIKNLKRIINTLDFYEGYSSENDANNEYIRIKTTVYIDKKEYSAWIYEYIKPVYEKQLIPNGDFLDLNGKE